MKIRKIFNTNGSSLNKFFGFSKEKFHFNSLSKYVFPFGFSNEKFYFNKLSKYVFPFKKINLGPLGPQLVPGINRGLAENQLRRRIA